MNPEVQKFWEDQGYTIESDILTSDQWKVVWMLIKDGREVRWIGVSEWRPSPYPIDKSNLPSCSIYFLDKKERTELEMLKLIKLKAFI